MLHGLHTRIGHLLRLVRSADAAIGKVEAAGRFACHVNEVELVNRRCVIRSNSRKHIQHLETAPRLHSLHSQANLRLVGHLRLYVVVLSKLEHNSRRLGEAASTEQQGEYAPQQRVDELSVIAGLRRMEQNEFFVRQLHRLKSRHALRAVRKHLEHVIEERGSNRLLL